MTTLPYPSLWGIYTVCSLAAGLLSAPTGAAAQSVDTTHHTLKVGMRTSKLIELENAGYVQESIVGIGDASYLYTYDQSGNAQAYSYSAYAQLFRGFNAISKLKWGTVRGFDANLKPTTSFDLPIPTSGKSDRGYLFGIGPDLAWSHVVSTADKETYALHLDRFSPSGELRGSEVVDTFPAKDYANFTTRVARSTGGRYVALLAATTGGGEWSMTASNRPAKLVVSVFDTTAQLVHRSDFELGLDAQAIGLFDFAVADDATVFVLAKYAGESSGRKNKKGVASNIRVYEFRVGERDAITHEINTLAGYLADGELAIQPDGKATVIGLWGKDADRKGAPKQYTGYYVGYTRSEAVVLVPFSQDILRELFPNAKVKSDEVLHLGSAYNIADLLTLRNGEVMLALQGYGAHTTSSGKVAAHFTTDALLVRVDAEAEVVDYEVVDKYQLTNPRGAAYLGLKLVECDDYAGVVYAKAVKRKGEAKEDGGNIRNSRLVFATESDGSKGVVQLQRRAKKGQDRMMARPSAAATLRPGEAGFVLRPPKGGKLDQYQISRTYCKLPEPR